jgi:hypothetical protein
MRHLSRYLAKWDIIMSSPLGNVRSQTLFVEDTDVLYVDIA